MIVFLYNIVSSLFTSLLLYTSLPLDNNYSLNKIYPDNIYYNVVLIEGQIYAGSNKGVYSIDNITDELAIIDNSIAGPINSNFEINNSHRISYQTSPTRLTSEYNESVTDFLYSGNKLYVISRGDLLILENKPYRFTPIGSVRSISKNSIGFYGGVYIDDHALSISYTDGQIREFDSITFVCYNGLISYQNGVEKILYNNDNSKISEAPYGRISDIFNLGNSNFLLISGKKTSSLAGDKGIYLFDLKSNNFKLIYSSKKNVIPIRNKIYARMNNSNQFHFIDDDNYFSLDLEDYSTKILDEDIAENITDILECSLDGSFFYAITKDNTLIKLERNYEGLEVVNSHPLDNSTHTIADIGETLFISGNNGLSLFDKSSMKVYSNIIVDEFNRGAFYKSNDSISFGSIHGVYEIENVSKFQTTGFINNLSGFNQKKNSSVEYVLILILVVTVLFFIYNNRARTPSNQEVILSIKKYINKNLRVVTLEILQDKFKLDYHEINSLSKEFKPAKYIKQQREQRVYEMLIENETYDNISLQTGYSITYLVKHKNRFLNPKIMG